MTTGFEEFSELGETGFESREPIAPEEEFFHSLYISGKDRKNHKDIVEKAGQLQVRGVDYNLKEVTCIITNIKQVLVKEERNPTTKRTSTTCFSYMVGEKPYKGAGGVVCGAVSAERAASAFCNTCRSHLIVSALLCDSNGKPIVGEDKKPLFIFLRGKGMKYSNISNYLGELSQLDLDPIFTPATEESKRFEKSVVNNKRFVTHITVGEASSNYGMVKIFELKKGIEIPKENVKKILEASKKTVDKFNEKFDWSKRNSGSSGYDGQQTAPVDNQFGDSDTAPQATTETAPEPTQDEKVTSFDEIEF